MNEIKWTENVILADADYVDGVAFDLTVNFERMLGRRVPLADMAQWVECVALDGGLKEGENETQVVLVHRRECDRMQNFAPGAYKDELDGKAFSGRLGEFVFTAVQTEEMATKEDLLLDTLQLVCAQPEVKRLMLVVPESLLDDVRQLLRRQESDERRTTVFTMQPAPGGAFRQEMLGFSLLAALGISSQEIEEKLTKQ
ncbi:MAG: hypothetical protein IJ570_09345 [Prevotella sp.]|nr:hypothetical protein [Prevotella sp.]